MASFSITQEEYMEYIRLKEKIKEADRSVAEELELRLRDLEYLTMNMRNALKKYYLIHDIDEEFDTEAMEEMYDISVSFDNGMITITLPDLLPHRRSRANIVFIDALNKALKDFKNGNPDAFSLFKKKTDTSAVVVFQHSYGNKRAIRDNDNIEIKGTLDNLVLNRYIRSDDGIYLKIFHTAKLEETDEDFTTIFILSETDFLENYHFFC